MVLRNFIPLIIFLLVVQSSFGILNAQRTPYRSHKFQFEKDFKIPDAVKAKFSDEDIVILEEEVEYSINQRTQPTSRISSVSRVRSSNIKKRMLLKIQTQEGLDQLSQFILPEPINNYLDDYEGLASRQIPFNDLKHLTIEVQYFEGRVLQPDGSQQRLVYSDKVVTEELGILGENHKAIEFHFDLKKLQVGSVLELAYEIYVPSPLGYSFVEEFNTNLNGFQTSPGFYYWWRFFFNRKYPVQKSKTTFSWFNELHLEWQFYNGAEPIDTINEVNSNKYIWEFQDLEACNFDLNSSPYQTLPHAHFYIHNFLYGDWNDTKLIKLKPYTWTYLCRDIMQFKGDNEVLTSSFSLKERMLNQFFNEHKDSSSIRTLKAMHNTMINKFDYGDNEAFYFGRDIDIYGPGRDLKNEKLHEVNRFDIYDGLLRRLGAEYYLVLAPDKRIASIDKDRPVVPINPIIFYAVKFGNTLVYLVPKHSKQGFLMDELPYFVEGQKALLIAQSARSKFNENNLIFLDLPESDSNSNFRNVQAKVKIDLNKQKVAVDSKLTLSGQLSSILRNYYAKKTEEKLYDKKYYKRFYDWDRPVDIKENLPLEVEEFYPFKAEKKVKFEADNVLKTVNDSIVEINLKGWLQQVEQEQYRKALKRDYTFDFQFKDRYLYMIEFDQPVQLIDNEQLAALNYEQEADFGTYAVRIQQQNPTQIMVESKLNLKAAVAKASEYNALKSIYRHISEVNKEAIIQVEYKRDTTNKTE